VQTESAVGATVAQGNSVEDDDDVEADGVTGDGRRQRVTLVSVVVGHRAADIRRRSARHPRAQRTRDR